jgi:hypothetical protein
LIDDAYTRARPYLGAKAGDAPPHVKVSTTTQVSKGVSRTTTQVVVEYKEVVGYQMSEKGPGGQQVVLKPPRELHSVMIVLDGTGPGVITAYPVP